VYRCVYIGHLIICTFLHGNLGSRWGVGSLDPSVVGRASDICDIRLLPGTDEIVVGTITRTITITIVELKMVAGGWLTTQRCVVKLVKKLTIRLHKE